MRSCGISLLSLKSLSLSVLSLSICMQLYRLYTYRNTVQHCATNHHLWHRFEFGCATYYWKHAAWTWRPPRPKDSRYLGPSNEQALPPIARPWRRHGWRGQLWGGLTLDSCDLVIDFPIAMKPEPCTQDRQWLATVQEWVRAAWLCLNNWATLASSGEDHSPCFNHAFPSCLSESSPAAGKKHIVHPILPQIVLLNNTYGNNDSARFLGPQKS